MRRLFWLVAAVVFADTMFFAAVAPLLPHYAAELGLSKTGAGILTAAYPAGAFAGALPAGWLAIRWGVKPTVMTGLVMLGVSSLAFAFAQDIVVLDVARFVQGIGGGGMWVAGLGWLVSAAPVERRGELIGSALSASIVGLLLGPVLGGAATVLSPEVVFSAVSVLAAVLTAWAWSMPGVEPEPSLGIGAMLRALRRPAVLVGCWLFMIPALFAGVIEVLVPLHMDELGAAGTAIGAVFLIAAGVEALISPVAGRWSDRAGRLAPIRAGLIGAAVMAVLLPFPRAAVLLGLAVVLAIAALAVFWAPGMAMLSDAAENAGLEQALLDLEPVLGDRAPDRRGRRRRTRRSQLGRRSLRTPGRGLRPHDGGALSEPPAPGRGDRSPGRLAAARPGRGAALAIQLERKPVLLPLRRVGRVALAAEVVPGLAAELVLAAVLAAR
jgi:MFS family permease